MADRLISADEFKDKARELIPPYHASVVMNLFDLIDNLADNMPTIETEPYIEFCEWVADTVLYEDFEDKWTLGAFAEVACRKLHKLGFVRKDGEYWTKDEVTK